MSKCHYCWTPSRILEQGTTPIRTRNCFRVTFGWTHSTLTPPAWCFKGTTGDWFRSLGFIAFPTPSQDRGRFLSIRLLSPNILSIQNGERCTSLGGSPDYARVHCSRVLRIFQSMEALLKRSGPSYRNVRPW